MNVGIISKEAHAKSHKKALKGAGHQVTMLGGHPTAIPDSLDVLVCRPASCAHGGFARAMEHKRAGHEVIIANGVNEIGAAIAALSNGSSMPTAAIPEEVTLTTVLDLLPRLLGVYSAVLHREEAGPVVQALAARRGDEGAKGLALWKRALKDVPYRSLVPYAKRQMEKRPTPEQAWVFSYPARGGVRRLPAFVEEEEALSVVLTMLNVAKTQPGAQKQLDKRVAASGRKSRRKTPPPAPTRLPTLAAAPAKVEPKKVEPAKAPPKAAAIPAPPPPPPAPIEELAACTAVEPPKPAAWDAQLKAAISMVLTEMKSARVKRLVIGDDGSVHFEREVIVVQVEDGSMTVAAD